MSAASHTLRVAGNVLGGALLKQAPELNAASGYGTSPYMLYSGWDSKGDFFYSMEILYGGIPGRPIGDGMDGHSWWPLFENIPTEYLEAYYPMRIDSYTTVEDTGGAGYNRGGNGVDTVDYSASTAAGMKIYMDGSFGVGGDAELRTCRDTLRLGERHEAFDVDPRWHHRDGQRPPRRAFGLGGRVPACCHHVPSMAQHVTEHLTRHRNAAGNGDLCAVQHDVVGQLERRPDDAELENTLAGEVAAEAKFALGRNMVAVPDAHGASVAVRPMEPVDTGRGVGPAR